MATIGSIIDLVDAIAKLILAATPVIALILQQRSGTRRPQDPESPAQTS